MNFKEIAIGVGVDTNIAIYANYSKVDLLLKSSLKLPEIYSPEFGWLRVYFVDTDTAIYTADEANKFYVVNLKTGHRADLDFGDVKLYWNYGDSWKGPHGYMARVVFAFSGKYYTLSQYGGTRQEAINEVIKYYEILKKTIEFFVQNNYKIEFDYMFYRGEFHITIRPKHDDYFEFNVDGKKDWAKSITIVYPEGVAEYVVFNDLSMDSYHDEYDLNQFKFRLADLKRIMVK